VRWLSSARERANFISTKEENGEDQLGAWRKTTSFGLNDLEVLMNVALEAKEWIAAHVLQR
jgi:hypothetical protein